MLLGTQRINTQGHLEIGGCDTVELARQFGTPLYVVDEEAFRSSARSYRRAFAARYPNSQVCFAGKALMTMAICRLAQEEGLGLDVASAGELHTALQAGFPVERMQLHGNFKTAAELEMGVAHRVGRIVVDSREEIEALQEEAARQGRVAEVLLRVTPGVTADTHYHIQTGKMDTKFGFSLIGGVALEAVQRAAAQPNLKVRGLHCHIGSQILEVEPFQEAARLMVDAAAEVREVAGVEIEDLDIGGGLGVRYLPEHRPPTVEAFAEALVEAVERRCQERELPLPRLLLEPGRSLSREAGTTLYTVGVVKELPGIRTYVSVDGGLSDNPRPALYGARYSAIVANKATLAREQKVTISGRHCETDTLIVEVHVPEVAAGDILAVQTTGAYNYAMASNYNRFARPAMVLVAGGQADVIVAREGLQDLVRQDRVPERLRGK
jgi:diaminopimelate decarboxylase